MAELGYLRWNIKCYMSLKLISSQGSKQSHRFQIYHLGNYQNLYDEEYHYSMIFDVCIYTPTPNHFIASTVTVILRLLLHDNNFNHPLRAMPCPVFLVPYSHGPRHINSDRSLIL